MPRQDPLGVAAGQLPFHLLPLVHHGGDARAEEGRGVVGLGDADNLKVADRWPAAADAAGDVDPLAVGLQQHQHLGGNTIGGGQGQAGGGGAHAGLLPESCWM